MALGGTGSTGTPSFCLKGIPQEDESSVKDSVTSGLLSKRPTATEEASGSGVEMFLDRTDLSKTVDRHGTERCHVLSRSSKFFAAVLLERQAVLVERGPVLAKNG